MVNLNDVRKVHFIGIAGAGMRAIANVFIEKGYIVSGSDLKRSAITDKFAEQGARICIGQKAENLQDAEVVVISSAIRETNAEVVEARRRHIPVIHRSDALVHIMTWGKGISVAGAHGKTTTSSMLGQVFEESHLEPTIVIGGEVDYLHSNSILGKGEYVIAEADESDGTFLKQSPYIAVVTNIDADHMDHYGSMDNVVEAFKEFIQKLDAEQGLAVLCFENEYIRRLAPSLQRRYLTYGIEAEADYQARNLHYAKGKLYFDVLRSFTARMQEDMLAMLQELDENHIVTSLTTVFFYLVENIYRNGIYKLLHEEEMMIISRKSSQDIYHDELARLFSFFRELFSYFAIDDSDDIAAFIQAFLCLIYSMDSAQRMKNPLEAWKLLLRGLMLQLVGE